MAALSCSRLQSHSREAHFRIKASVPSSYSEGGPGNIMSFVYSEWQQELQALSTECDLWTRSALHIQLFRGTGWRGPRPKACFLSQAPNCLQLQLSVKEPQVT